MVPDRFPRSSLVNPPETLGSVGNLPEEKDQPTSNDPFFDGDTMRYDIIWCRDMYTNIYIYIHIYV